MRKFFIFLLSSLAAISLFSHDFTRKDSLRGTLSQYRTCYDVNYNNLFVIDEYADLSIFVIGVSTGAVVVELSLT